MKLETRIHTCAALHAGARSMTQVWLSLRSTAMALWGHLRAHRPQRMHFSISLTILPPWGAASSFCSGWGFWYTSTSFFGPGGCSPAAFAGSAWGSRWYSLRTARAHTVNAPSTGSPVNGNGAGGALAAAQAAENAGFHINFHMAAAACRVFPGHLRVLPGGRLGKQIFQRRACKIHKCHRNLLTAPCS